MVVAEDLSGFGEQIEKLTFKDHLDWFIKVRDPCEAFAAQPTYILSEYLFYLLGIITLIHAFAVGGRWKYFWFAAIIHGLTTECISFWFPDIDNYWHSQTSIMLLGRRLPLHIPLIYPVFMYSAAYMVAHMRLPQSVEPLAAGLGEVLMDLPYDIAAVKFVHWTWHDTDPNIYDRHYWVPWNSYYFHLAFGTAFNYSLNFWRKRITGSSDKTQASSCGKELLSSTLAGLCGMPGGILQFIVLYHPLHDIFGIHTENCVFLIATLYFFLVWRADRTPVTEARRRKGDTTHWSAYLLVFGLIMHYGLYLGMTIFGHPEREVSMGLHEKTGSCQAFVDVNTAFGMTLKKRQYLCTKDYDEQYFDFHCLSKPPKDGVEWYTICGTPFKNRGEYISTLLGVCLVAFFVFSSLLFQSSSTIRSRYKKETPAPKVAAVKLPVKSKDEKKLKKK